MAASKITDTTTKILSIPDDQFQNIRIKTIAGDTIDLDRSGGKWAMTQPKPLAADQDAVSSVVSTLSALNADKVVGDKAADLQSTAWIFPPSTSPSRRRTVRSASFWWATPRSILPATTPWRRAIRACSHRQRRQERARQEARRLARQAPDDVRFGQADPRGTAGQGADLEFGKNGQSEWQIVKPRPLRADSSAIASLVDKLHDAKMDTSEFRKTP